MFLNFSFVIYNQLINNEYFKLSFVPICVTIILKKDYNAIIDQKLPPKLKDPGTFTLDAK